MVIWIIGKSGAGKSFYAKKLLNKLKSNYYDVIVYAVDHKIFKKIKNFKIKKISKDNSIIYDLKYALDKKIVDLRL